MHESFSELVTFCGTPCQVQTPLSNMKPHISYFAKEALQISQSKGGVSTPTLAPYIGRGLLEATLTAILFRLDPFRALTLMRFQTHGEFDHNRPNNISIDWNGDLISDLEERTDIWKPRQKPENVSRGLLSPYMDQVIWRPALSSANDSLDTVGVKPAFPTRLAKDPDDFINGIRGEARQLYSFWSKGIHGEFFAIGPQTLDDITCADPFELRDTNPDYAKIEIPVPGVEQDLAILEKPIATLTKSNAYPYGLTDDKVSRLEGAGLDTILAVAEATDETILGIYGIGGVHLRRIRDVVHQAIWM